MGREYPIERMSLKSLDRYWQEGIKKVECLYSLIGNPSERDCILYERISELVEVIISGIFCLRDYEKIKQVIAIQEGDIIVWEKSKTAEKIYDSIGEDLSNNLEEICFENLLDLDKKT